MKKFKISNISVYPMFPEFAHIYYASKPWLTPLSTNPQDFLYSHFRINKIPVLPKMTSTNNYDIITTETNGKDASERAIDAISDSFTQLLQDLIPNHGHGYDQVTLPTGEDETYIFNSTSNRHETVTRLMVSKSSDKTKTPWTIPYNYKPTDIKLSPISTEIIPIVIVHVDELP